jgi:histone-lysine N-methyltransferase SETMAR
LLIDYLARGETITGFYYSQPIARLCNTIKEKRRGKLHRGILFHQENAPVHMSLVSMGTIRDAGFELLDHSPYSPDPAPSDYFLFPQLKKSLEEKNLGLTMN